nr:uncharacterized protein LOC117279185 [Nicotiana tomentosiformis]
MRGCPPRGGSSVAQLARSVAASSAPAHPQGQVPQTQVGHGTCRGGAPTTGGPQNHPGSTLSYATPFVTTKFGKELEDIKPYEVATPIGYSVVARRVFRGCTIVIGDRSNTTNLIELEVVDFDVILGNGWLSSCYANVHCRESTVQFNFPKGLASKSSSRAGN